MGRRSVSSKATFALIAWGLVLPIAITVIVAVAALLNAMGDAAGSAVLHYVGLACGIGWIIVLVSLVLVQGFKSLDDSGDSDESSRER